LPAVAHHRGPALTIASRGELGQKLVELRSQRLGDQPLRTLAQHRAQQILPLWLLQ
jgi:hypothetical protein